MDDRVQRLASVVAAARRAPFWRRRLPERPIRSLADFEALPVTAVSEYRRQPLRSLLADADAIEWLPGSWLGSSPHRAPMMEGAREARVRVGLLTDALSLAMPSGVESPSAVALTTAERRYFGAEACAALVRMGVAAHLVADAGAADADELLAAFAPNIVLALSPRLALERLPASVSAIVSVNERIEEPSRAIGGARRVDMLVQNELGVLGASVGGAPHRMNRHRFHLERSPRGTLVATPYFARVQPVIRLDTGIRATVLH